MRFYKPVMKGDEEGKRDELSTQLVRGNKRRIKRKGKPKQILFFQIRMYLLIPILSNQAFTETFQKLQLAQANV